MSESRPRRANAGRNISKLINQELGGDEFYSSVYGGFEEEEEDQEYETEGSEEDTVDSDFDVDESQWDEPADTQDDEEDRKRKKKEWVKPYKPKATETKPPKPKKPRTTVTTTTVYTSGGPEPTQRTFRKSTHDVSQEYKKRFELEEEEQRRRRMYHARKAKPERKLTQKELLEEAKLTERENLASLEAYSRLEAEKKKTEKKKVMYSGPVVRFHSVAMPTVPEIQHKTIDHSLPSSTDPFSNPMNPTTDTKQSASKKSMYTRNFLVFTDTQAFPSEYFPTDKPKYPRKRFCPITGLPAKYVDPLTGTPYATPGAFRVIRNKYVSEGEQTCERRLVQLSSWLLEKKRKKMEVTL